MNRYTIALNVGAVIIEEYRTNIIVFMDNKRLDFSLEGIEEFTTDESLEGFIDYYFEPHFHIYLKEDDKSKLKNVLEGCFYLHSSEYYSTLKLAREDKGISQKQLSELSGVNLRMIQKYEQGDRHLEDASVSTVHKLADALDTTIDELMGW